MAKKAENTSKDITRPPIVTVMGHVDHGKTSILDAIRKTNIQGGEYGGITQHIGAYQIIHANKKITFIDTPGHAAFTQMRSRGGKAADIVVLVVAADEGVKPQTKEAISHAKVAGAPIIVAINKMDKAGADPQKVKQGLARESVLTEDWGGDVISVNVSAKTGEGLGDLLDAILVLAEVINIAGDKNGELEAVIIESKVDRKRGVVVSGIIRNGTLSLGDEVVASGLDAKIKSIGDDKGERLKSATLSTPVEILGFKDTPHVGDLIVKKGSDLEELSIDEGREEIIGKDAKKTISLVLKTDTQGTLEAVKGSLADLITSSIEATYALKFVHTATGDISESDVMLASSTDGVVIGFNVRLPSSVSDYADSQRVVIRVYKTIYELIDDAKDLLEGTASKEEAKIKGRAQIQKTFKLPSGDVIAGCKVLAGAVKEGSRISLYDKDPADLTEEDVPIYTGVIKKIKHKKDDVSMAGKDTECGILLKPKFEGLLKGLWVEVDRL
ncbi:translation initiation factor IF-2 [Patescibacteria group bacterium]|nr:translation initiation factor IF-2 [Patescibacteria group bacterium]